MKFEQAKSLAATVEKLDELYHAMMAQDKRMDEMDRAVSEQLTCIVLEKYPHLPDLDSDGIRKLGALVCRTSQNFAVDLEALAQSSQPEK